MLSSRFNHGRQIRGSIRLDLLEIIIFRLIDEAFKNIANQYWKSG